MYTITTIAVANDSYFHNDSSSKTGSLYLTKKKLFITKSAQTPPVFSKHNMSPKTTNLTVSHLRSILLEQQ